MAHHGCVQHPTPASETRGGPVVWCLHVRVFTLHRTVLTVNARQRPSGIRGFLSLRVAPSADTRYPYNAPLLSRSLLGRAAFPVPREPSLFDQSQSHSSVGPRGQPKVVPEQACSPLGISEALGGRRVHVRNTSITSHDPKLQIEPNLENSIARTVKLSLFIPSYTRSQHTPPRTRSYKPLHSNARDV
jgi:hypothetical protein